MNQSGLPNEVYTVCLSVAKHWCAYSSKTFIINEQFVETILKLLANETSILLIKKVINVIKRMLKTSDHARLLGEGMKFEFAIAADAIPAIDL